jgi:phosphoribosylformylglycinamidine synthase
LRHGFGARIVLPAGTDAFVALLSESAGRAIVTVPRSEEGRFTALCITRGLPHNRTGVVDSLSTALEIEDQFRISLPELQQAWSATLPRLFG